MAVSWLATEPDALPRTSHRLPGALLQNLRAHRRGRRSLPFWTSIQPLLFGRANKVQRRWIRAALVTGALVVMAGATLIALLTIMSLVGLAALQQMVSSVVG